VRKNKDNKNNEEVNRTHKRNNTVNLFLKVSNYTYFQNIKPIFHITGNGAVPTARQTVVCTVQVSTGKVQVKCS